MDDASLLEVVELSTGEIALKRVGDDRAPLIKINFSVESERAIIDMKMTVARAMIEAGIEAYVALQAEATLEQEFEEVNYRVH